MPPIKPTKRRRSPQKPSESGNSNQARVVAILGATGTGKTTKLKAQIASLPNAHRSMVWSPKEPVDRYVDLFPGSVLVRSADEVRKHLSAAWPNKPVHLVYWSRLDFDEDTKQFDQVCRYCMDGKNINLFVDEAHTVTRPGWAPRGWKQVVLMGRGYGMGMYVMSQRPTGIDKEFWSNTSRVNVGRMSFGSDCKTVAEALGVPWREIANLSGFQWIERDMFTGKVTRGS